MSVRATPLGGGRVAGAHGRQGHAQERALTGSGPEAAPVRILWVFAWLGMGGEQSELRLLVRDLDRRRYRIDVVACFRPDGVPDAAHEQLTGLGIDVDRYPYSLSFADTVDYLAAKIPAYDIVVGSQNVADLYPALEKLHIRPPVIEYGQSVSEALAGPKHFTSRYIGVSRSVSEAAATCMAERPHHALEVPPMRDWPRLPKAVVPRWVQVFDAVLAERVAAPRPALFRSFFQGGFECSTHRRRDGRRLDLLAQTGHDIHAAADYCQLRTFGMETVRDGLRWHLIEKTPGRYDWSSFLPMLRAAREAGTEVIWDLLHFGWPEDLDIWRPAFVDRFARFAAAAAQVVKNETDTTPFFAPVNEMSFLSWGGGDEARLNPFALHRGHELKCQLVRAAITAMDAIWLVEPRARFVHPEPAINVLAATADPMARGQAEDYRLAQYQAWDMMAGLSWPQLGGSPRYVDILGINYYEKNQWIHEAGPIDVGHPRYKPFRYLLTEAYARYGRPLMVSETGTEDERRPSWLAMMASETRAAMAAGVPVEGICLYPIIDHQGWDDDRHCRNGLLDFEQPPHGRQAYAPLAEELQHQRRIFAPLL